MFGIPLPWLLVGLFFALFGTYRGGYHYGWTDRDAEMQIAIAKKNEEARELEKNMSSKLADQETKLRKAQDDIAKKQSAMHELARTGRLRLPTPSCVQATPNPTPTTTDSKAGSQPDRQANEASDAERATLQAIAEIVAQGDKNTAALNACVDSYNQMRDLLNDKR